MGRTRISNRRSPRNDQDKLDEVLCKLTEFNWSLGYFLLLLFSSFGAEYSQRRTPRHIAYVSYFLGRRSDGDKEEPKANSLPNILSLMYNHPNGIPTRNSTVTDLACLARPRILAWSQSVITSEITREADKLTKQESECLGLHLPPDEQGWETIAKFSLESLRDRILEVAPVLCSMLVSVATSTATVKQLSSHGPSSSKTRDPELVSIIAILMLMVCRNQQANMFQKVIGVWLFACSAPAHVFRVLCRIGLCAGYVTILKACKRLSDDSIKTTRSLAAHLRFLVIFDNINRKRKFWRPALGQLDLMMSGTAATFVELLERTAKNAFEFGPVLEARRQKLRQSLTAEILYDHVDQAHLSSVMALHCVSFLVSNCSALSPLSSYVTEQLRTTFAIRRMPDHTKTKVHPLSTSGINEGSAAGCRDVLTNILLEQLKLPADIVNSIMVIVGGDLGTIEKIRNLKTLEASCPHGFPSFSWVIPLVQLWHMGWADLARIINTYWGKPASSDPSSLWFSCKLLGRKVKPERRPEYYPALALVTDTLEADVLDCWRLLLKTNNLDTYFSSLEQVPTGAELFEKAEVIVSRWASTHAHDIATFSDGFWDGPTSSLSTPDGDNSDSDEPLQHKQDKQRSKSNSTGKKPRAKRSRKKHKTEILPDQLKGFQGDHCLANSIIRKRDSLWHYEFLYAIADGDIGRVMKVMSAWQFTFTGSGASKYSTELLELASDFLFEFPLALQEALMDNWLCNLSGLPGCWFPMDLMQEHSIRELKDKSQRRDEDFGGEFFQDVISRNIRCFTEVKSTINMAVGLQDRSSAHGSKKSQGTANQLRKSLETTHAHYFVSGRSHGWLAQDDFVTGLKDLPAKITHFLRQTPSIPTNSSYTNGQEESQPLQTSQDGIDIARPETEEGSDEPEIGDPPAPVMVVNGRIIVGDVTDEDYNSSDEE